MATLTTPAGRVVNLLDALLGWCSDGCPACEPHEATLPVMALEDGDDLLFYYRCRVGHDWWCRYDPAFAMNHAAGTRAEVAHGARCFPSMPWRLQQGVAW